MNNYVLIVDTNKQPLKPTTPKRARELLNKAKAAIYRYYPFTLILAPKQDRQHEPLRKPQPMSNLELRIDPGSVVTGLALVNSKRECIWAMELEHRGRQITNALIKRMKKGTYVARVKTPTRTGVEVKINGHRISTKLYNFIHRSDGYDYSFGEVMSI